MFNILTHIIFNLTPNLISISLYILLVSKVLNKEILCVFVILQTLMNVWPNHVIQIQFASIHMAHLIVPVGKGIMVMQG